MKKMNGIHSVFMLRPKKFGFNSGTKNTNPFQNEVKFDQKYIANKAKAEFNDMVNILRSQKIAVHAFEEDSESDLPDAVYLNNWLAITPEKNLYLFPMAAKSRRKERSAAVIDELKEIVEVLDTVDLSYHEETGKYLESTGSVVFDYENRMAYAAISKRTDAKLFDDFCEEINFTGFSFNSSDLNGQSIYHTNILLSIAHSFVLICIDCIETAIEKALIIKMLERGGKTIIDISINQMMNFAGNCLEVFDENNQSKLVMSRTGYHSLKQEQIDLIEQFSEIIVVNVSIIERVGGGSARCMMLGVPY